MGELEYETNANLVDKYVENSIPFSKKIEAQPEPIIAMRRTIKIPKNEKVVLNFIITVSENKNDIIKNTKYYSNEENIKREFEIARARAEEEAKYLRINGEDLKVYQRLLAYIIFNNPMKKLELKKIKKRNYKQEELWKYGISGDNPILLVLIRDLDDIQMIKEVLKAYEFYKNKNVKFDLVILDEEKTVYEKYLKDAIIQEISSFQLYYLINKGIYVVDNTADKDLFIFKSNFIIEASKGRIRNVLNEYEEDYVYSIKDVEKDKNENLIKHEFENIKQQLNVNNLKYFNEYGGFSEDGKEYRIKQDKNNRLPTVWSHIIANENFGTLVTNNLGGFTWNKNSRLNRLTAWSNDTVKDEPSEIIYLKDLDEGESWSLGENPKSNKNEYLVTFGFGYAKFYNSNCGISQELNIFVPLKESIKVNLLTLKNNTQTRKNIRLIYYIKPVIGEDEIKSNGCINLNFNKNSNLLYADNLYSNLNCGTTFMACNEEINSYTGNKTSFIGNGDLSNPEGIDKISLTNENSLGSNSCIAIEVNVTIYPYESKEMVFLLGQGKDKVEVQDLVYKYSDIKKCKKEFGNVKEYWKERLGRLQVCTPTESMNIMLNGWLLYQMIVCRLWAKSAFYQSGGAYGFRDQLQDVMGLKYTDPETTRKQILKHSMHQFKEGDVEHWWHEETNKGIRTRFSDDLLWLPYVVAEYIKATDDLEILNEETNYVCGRKLEIGENEIYAEHSVSNDKDTILEHCIRAIEKSFDFGENGIPKIGSGDWNDGFSRVGVLGKGESVWLGFFLYTVLEKFIEILNIVDKEKYKDKILKYNEVKNNLKKSLNNNCWDGRWFKRAFMDDGNTLGSIENEECRIDSIAQSWSVISNAGDNDKKYISMESLDNHLVDREAGIIKLLDPPFNKSNLEPGYIKMYLPGTRENGGQYTHEYCACVQFYKILILLS
jgi:cellobiose phosphorylase